MGLDISVKFGWAFFLLFCVSRLALHRPDVYFWWGRKYLIQFCPLCFLLGSTLYSWICILTGQNCEILQSELFNAYRENTLCSILLSMACIAFLLRHDMFLNHFIFEAPAEEVIFPNVSDFMGTLETTKYNSSVFDFANGKPDCPICLDPWGEGDDIKVTPCCHYFHKDCLGSWLHKAFTCAVCPGI